MRRLTLYCAAVFTASLAVFACRSAPEPPRTETEPIPYVEKPNTFHTNWRGTTWIVRDPDMNPWNFPGYQGFHLGRDGRLLLINLDSSTGEKWTAHENVLTFALNENSPGTDLVSSGTFMAYQVDDGIGKPPVMRLVPEDNTTYTGPVFEQAKARVDIIENHWIPKRLEGGQAVKWPVQTKIYFIVLPDVSGGLDVLGYGGENRFRGGLEVDDHRFKVGPLAVTRRYGPSSDFEQLYIERISEADRYVQVDDDLFLYRETSPVAAFRVQIFD